MAKKASPRGKRYSAAAKKKILAIAAREKLTGAQVKQRFGVSTLSFYRWRGPVRPRGKSGAGSPGRAVPGDQSLREQVRRSVREILPGVIRTEVAAYLERLLPRRGPGRPRKGA